jgi:hypothetical protein
VERQSLGAEQLFRRPLQFLMAEEVRLGGKFWPPVTASPGEAAPSNGPKMLFDPPRRLPGQVAEIKCGQATARDGEIAEQGSLVWRALEQFPQFSLHVRADDLGGGRRAQRPNDAGNAKWVMLGHVLGHRRVRSRRDDHTHPGGQFHRQERRDGVGVQTGRHPTVLIEAVNDQHQLFAAVTAQHCRVMHHPEQVHVAGGVGRLRHRQPQNGGQLLDEVVRESDPVVLAREPCRDEEGNEPDLRRRVQEKPRHQRGFARPRLRPPP